MTAVSVNEQKTDHSDECLPSFVTAHNQSDWANVLVKIYLMLPSVPLLPPAYYAKVCVCHVDGSEQSKSQRLNLEIKLTESILIQSVTRCFPIHLIASPALCSTIFKCMVPS